MNKEIDTGWISTETIIGDGDGEGGCVEAWSGLGIQGDGGTRV